MYREDSLPAGLGRRRRAQLAVLHRRFPGPFNATQAASVLGTAIAPTRRLLAALAAGGWLSRVRPGWYIAVPLEASEPSEWREDPWIVAATLFGPGYIGGWSAAEHWGLTDQIFSVIYVVSGKKVTPSSTVGSGYRLHHPERAQGGTVRHAACLAPTGACRRIRPAPHRHRCSRRAGRGGRCAACIRSPQYVLRECRCRSSTSPGVRRPTGPRDRLQAPRVPGGATAACGRQLYRRMSQPDHSRAELARSCWPEGRPDRLALESPCEQRTACSR